jgi:FixJ family two-component response regulator
VLVVEDNECMREAIENLVEVAGYSAFSYASAELLIAGRRVEKALCIICNIRLPAMSGFELIKTLRTRATRTPVILITADGTPGLRSKAKRSGAAAYLAKPIGGSALLEAIESVVVAGRPKPEYG